jgi:hypothetical protein
VIWESLDGKPCLSDVSILPGAMFTHRRAWSGAVVEVAVALVFSECEMLGSLQPPAQAFLSHKTGQGLGYFVRELHSSWGWPY